MSYYDDYKASIMPQKMTPVAPQQPTAEPGNSEGKGDFMRGLSAGWEETKAMGSGLAMMAGDVTGIDSLSEWGEEGYREGMAQAGKYAPPEQASKIEDIDSVGEFVDWGQYQLGKLMPMVATSVFSGGVGGFAAKGLASAGLKAAAQQGIKGGAQALGKRATAGAMAGTAASSVGMETGLIAGDIKERTGESDPLRALAYGSAAGLLDVLPQMRILKKLGLGKAAEEGTKKLTRGQLGRKVGAEIGKQGVFEGATEAGQEVIEEAAVWDSMGKDLTSPEALKAIFDKSKLMNAAAVGALGGSVLGGTASAYTEVSKQGKLNKLEKAKREATGEGQVFSGQEGSGQTQEAEMLAAVKDTFKEQGLESRIKGFYSATERGAKNLKQKKGTAEQMLNMLRKEKNVKQDEIDALGLEEWANLKGTVTKDEMVDYVRKGGVQVEEEVKGGQGGITLDMGESLEATSELKQYGIEFVPTNEQGNDFNYPVFFDKEAGEFIKLDQLEEWMDENATPEVMDAAQALYHDDRGIGTEYSDNSYQMEGERKGYKELLLTLPKSGMQEETIGGISQEMFGKSFQSLTNSEQKLVFNAYDKEKTLEKDIDFTGQHFQDTKNILAHVRFNEREIDGKRTLFIEEFQSDWAQDGRKKGFKQDKPITGLKIKSGKREKGYFEIVDGDGRFVTNVTEANYDGVLTEETALTEAERRVREEPMRTGRDDRVPAAPFISTTKKASFAKGVDKNTGKPIYQIFYGSENGKPTHVDTKASRAEARSAIKELNAKKELQENTEGWSMLAFKRMLEYAKENGFEQISWTPGEVQNKRYKLSNQVSEITYVPETSEIYFTSKETGEEGSTGIEDGKTLADYVGKGVAEKLEADVASGIEQPTISGDNLDIGGEGMKSFYDKMMPSNVNKYLKKQGYGEKVGVSKVNNEASLTLEEIAANFNMTKDEYLNIPLEERNKLIDKYRIQSGQDVWTVPLSQQTKEKIQAEKAPLFSEKKQAIKREEGTEKVWASLEKSLGQRQTKRMSDAGLITVMRPKQFENTFNKKAKEVQGIFRDGKIYVHSGTENPLAVILHEGTHSNLEDAQAQAGLRLLLGDSYMAMQRQFDRLIDTNDQVAVQAAYQAAQVRERQAKLFPETSKKLLAEREMQERLAYYAEYSQETNTALGKRIVAQVKAWFRQSDFGKLLAKHGIKVKLDNAMIVELAKMSLGRTAALNEWVKKNEGKASTKTEAKATSKGQQEESPVATDLESFIGEIDKEKLTTQIKEIGESKRFNVEQTEKFDNKAVFTVSPSEKKNLKLIFGSTFTDKKGKVSTNSPLYYDPRLVEIETRTDVDEEYGTFVRKIPRLKKDSGLVDRITAKKQKDIIWRGMSSDEYEGILKNGFIKSRGLWNIGPEQAETTSFGVNPRTAEFYANGFAPAQFKAMPGYNAYAVAIKDPKNSLEIAGNGEKDIPGKINAEDIVEVWEGVPFAVNPGTYDTIREPWNKEFTSGSSNGVTSMVGWKQIKGEKKEGKGDLESRAVTEDRPAFHDFSKEQLKRWSGEFEKQGIYVTRMKPEDFIKLTSPKGTYERIMAGELPSISEVDSEGKVKDKFDPKETDRNIRAAAPLLQITADGEIKEHEGRHRAALLMRDGATSMAVVIRPDVYAKANEIWGAKNWVKDQDELPPKMLKPQMFGTGDLAVGKPVKIGEGKILGYESTNADFDAAMKIVGPESEQQIVEEEPNHLESRTSLDAIIGEEEESDRPGARNWAEKRDNFLYYGQDKLRYLYTKQKQIEIDQGKQLADDQDAYLQETLYHGKVKSRLGTFHTDVRDPLLNQIRKLGRKIDGKNGIDRFLHARHAQEANERLRRINAKRFLQAAIPLMEDTQRLRVNAAVAKIKKDIAATSPTPTERAFNTSSEYLALLESELQQLPAESRHMWERFKKQPSGMTDVEAQKILDDTAASRYGTKLNSIGDAFDTMNRDALKSRYDAGLMTEAEYDAINGAYKHWAPLRREGYEDKTGGKGQGYSIAGNEFIVRAGDSTSKVVDVLANAISASEMSIIRAEKQEVVKALYNMIRNNRDENFWRVDREDETPAVDADGSIRMYKSVRDRTYEVRIKIDGKKHRIRFEPTNENAYRIAHGLKNLDNAGGSLVGALSQVNRLLSFVNTSASPEFMLSNFIRDLQTAMINVTDTDARKVRAKILRDVIPAGLGIRSSLRDKGTGTWATWYKEFSEQGGTTGWIENYNSIHDVRTKLNKQMKRLKRGSSRNIFEGVVDTISDYNTAVENGVRLATYKNLVESGLMTKARAAQVAKELTVNFNRKGAAGQLVNALYLFANAGIQGSMRIIRAARYSHKVQAMLGGIVGASVGMALANRDIGGDDEDGVPYYDKIPNWVKERNMIFMIPDSKGDYVKVPLPWGYNVFWVVGDQMAAAGLHTFTDSKAEFSGLDAAATVAQATFSAFSPISGGTMAQMISPTITDPIVQIAENKTFTGAPLSPEQNPFAKIPKPDFANYFKSARTTSKVVAKGISDLTGGDDVKAGFADVSPETLDLWWDTVLGSAGRFVADSGNLAFQAAKGKAKEVDTKRTPFLRRVYGKHNNSVDNQLYRDRVKEVYVAEEQLKQARGTENYADVREETRSLVRLSGAVKVAEKQMRQLRKLRNSARTEERKESVTRRMERLMAKFNLRYRRMLAQGKL